MVRNTEHVHDSAAVPTMVPGGGLVEPGVAWAAVEEDPLMLGGGDYMFLGNGDGGKLMHRGGGSGFHGPVSNTEGSLLDCVDWTEFFDDGKLMHRGGSSGFHGPVSNTEGSLLDCVDWTEFFEDGADSLWPPTYQPAADNSLLTTNQQAAVVVGPSGAIICSPPTPPVHEQTNYHQLPGSNSSGLTQVSVADDSPGPTSSPLGAYPHAPAPAPAPDSEVAQMVRVAAECGADKASSTVWSQEEDELLLQGLSLFADEDHVVKCFSIASGLVKKTTLDVAYRIRWLDLEKKKEAAKRAELGQKLSAGEKVTKGKGAKGSNKKNNKCPLSEEDLNSKSTEDLKQDNNRLLNRIEDILRTGQFKDIPDYFYRVKINMDALNKKLSDSATVMGGVSVGEEEWEDVLRDRSSSDGN